MEKNRLYFLDGLRGWGAVGVYLLHLSAFLFPRGKYSFFDAVYYKTPLRIISDGESAILLFFILSGFSLSYKFFSKQGDYSYLREAAIYRYFRLLIPVFFAVLITYFLIKFHLIFNTRTLFGIYTTPFSLQAAFQYTFVELPFKFFAPHGIYGSVFWTIYLEFTASLFIFSFLALFGTSNLRFFLYPLIFIAIHMLGGFANFYALFFAGILICDLFCMQNNNRERNPNPHRQKTRIVGMVSFFLLLFVYYYGAVCEHKIFLPNSRYLFVILLFVFTLYIPLFNNFFSSKLSKFLGRISFSLYLIHLPILCSLSCYALNFMRDNDYPLVLCSLVVSSITTIVTVCVAYIFTLCVEERILVAVKLGLKKIGEAKNLVRSATMVAIND